MENTWSAWLSAYNYIKLEAGYQPENPKGSYASWGLSGTADEYHRKMLSAAKRMDDLRGSRTMAAYLKFRRKQEGRKRKKK